MTTTRHAALTVLALIVGALFAAMLWAVDPGGTTSSSSRCPEDAVQLLRADSAPACIPADDFAPGTTERATATVALSTCAVGTAVLTFDAAGTVTASCR